MVASRPVPVDVLPPHLTYEDVAAAAWLSTVFGFTEHYRYGPADVPSGAQLHLGRVRIMLDAPGPGRQAPVGAGHSTQSLTVFVPDVAAHYARAKSAGAEIVEDLHEASYGGRRYGARDFAGHHWLFTTHDRDVSPAAWGRAHRAAPAAVTPLAATCQVRRFT